MQYDMIHELDEAPAFSVMADTTPDSSDKDQLSIIVRYFIDDKPVERLLCLQCMPQKIGTPINL